MAKVDAFANQNFGNIALFSDVASGGGAKLPYTGDITKYGYGPQHSWFAPGSSGGGLPGPSPTPMPSPGPGPSLGQPDAGSGNGPAGDNSGGATSAPGGLDGVGTIGEGGISTRGAEGVSDAQKLADGNPAPTDFQGLVDKAMAAMQVERFSSQPFSLSRALKGGSLTDLRLSSLPAGVAAVLGGPVASVVLDGINFGAGATIDSVMDQVFAKDAILGHAFERARKDFKTNPAKASADLEWALHEQVVRDYVRSQNMEPGSPEWEAGVAGLPAELRGHFGFVDPDFVPGSLNPVQVAQQPLTAPAGGNEDDGGFDFDGYTEGLSKAFGLDPAHDWTGGGMTQEQFNEMAGGKMSASAPAGWDSTPGNYEPGSYEAEQAEKRAADQAAQSGWDGDWSFGSEYGGGEGRVAGTRDGSGEGDNEGRGGGPGRDDDSGYDRGDSGRD